MKSTFRQCIAIVGGCCVLLFRLWALFILIYKLFPLVLQFVSFERSDLNMQTRNCDSFHTSSLRLRFFIDNVFFFCFHKWYNSMSQRRRVFTHRLIDLTQQLFFDRAQSIVATTNIRNFVLGCVYNRNTRADKHVWKINGNRAVVLLVLWSAKYAKCIDNNNVANRVRRSNYNFYSNGGGGWRGTTIRVVLFQDFYQNISNIQCV